ncbi:Uncharacterized protein Fot_35672 [Forsythia ovata]|uniref:Uncharacterized protein n=1 Tax=Forsythia ovata TaxID=205694 RepID=A0ABD1SNL2_9LAMI
MLRLDIISLTEWELPKQPLWWTLIGMRDCSFTSVIAPLSLVEEAKSGRSPLSQSKKASPVPSVNKAYRLGQNQIKEQGIAVFNYVPMRHTREKWVVFWELLWIDFGEERKYVAGNREENRRGRTLQRKWRQNLQKKMRVNGRVGEGKKGKKMAESGDE